MERGIANNSAETSVLDSWLQSSCTHLTHILLPCYHNLFWDNLVRVHVYIRALWAQRHYQDSGCQGTVAAFRNKPVHSTQQSLWGWKFSPNRNPRDTVQWDYSQEERDEAGWGWGSRGHKEPDIKETLGSNGFRLLNKPWLPFRPAHLAHKHCHYGLLKLKGYVFPVVERKSWQSSETVKPLQIFSLIHYF